jgi:tetrapyrrole methylase family protein/MazG family protein
MGEMDRLRQVMDRLRGPDGCPWDREQTLETLKTFLLEETYEVLEAISSGSAPAHKEELGDLLFQIVFQARLAQERGDFTLDDVMRDIGDKIIRRHPHVFGDGALETADQVLAQWEQLKAEERRGRADGSMFATVPAHLPALLKALRISAKAARVGFDWPDLAGLMAKYDEETSELRDALDGGRRERIAEELGDLLFVVANIARHLEIDPEDALQAANRKFVTRFRHVEERLAGEGLRPAPEHRRRMDELWNEAKRKPGARRSAPGRTSPSGGISGSGTRPARTRSRS